MKRSNVENSVLESKEPHFKHLPGSSDRTFVPSQKVLLASAKGGHAECPGVVNNPGEMMLTLGHLVALVEAVTNGQTQDLFEGKENRTCSWVGCKCVREEAEGSSVVTGRFMR